MSQSIHAEEFRTQVVGEPKNGGTLLHKPPFMVCNKDKVPDDPKPLLFLKAMLKCLSTIVGFKDEKEQGLGES